MGSLNTVDPTGTGARISSPLEQPRRKSRWWLWLLILLLVGLAVWRYRAGSAADSQAQNPSAGGRSGAGGLVVPVVVATAQRGDLPVYFNGLGTVTAFNTVTVHTRVDGQVDKVVFTEGQFVHQGDLLVELDPRPFQMQLEQAQGQLAKDEAQLRDAQINADRYVTLYKEGIFPKQQADTQQAQADQFKGSIQSDQAQIDNAKLQLIYCRVTAPISGRVGLRLVDAGNIVHANDQNGLVVITQLQPIAVIFSLPQDQLPPVNAKLRAGAQLPVEAFDRNDTAKIETGKLLTIDNQIDTNTGTFKLKAVFDNPNNILFPNQFVNVHLLADTVHGLVVVPTAAIQRGPQGTYVYAVDNTGKAHIRVVTVALSSGNSVGLSAGLDPGALVVIDGQDRLQEGSKVEAHAAASGGGSSGPQSQTNPPASGQTPAGQPAGKHRAGGPSQ
jgi:membrane fusion protein, multidrug efflux system